MLIIEPQAQLWTQGKDPISHVAKCTRVCYGNAISKGKKADQALYDNLKKSGHLSMFRHESVYAIIPETETNTEYLEPYNESPYIDIVWPQYASNNTSIYVATNRNFLLDNDDYMISDIIENHKVTPEYFASTEIGHPMMRYTFHITTQISTSRELNRVSPNNIAERSTRYCLEKGVICRPYWLSEEAAKTWECMQLDNIAMLKPTKENLYLTGCMAGFNGYNALIELGMKSEDARGILPLDTATEVVYTYNLSEWKHIIELRTAPNAHPNCRIIANMIKQQLEQLGYTF